MAVTHRFVDDKHPLQGGRWFDDYGRLICAWEWDLAERELTVTCGNCGRRIDLSQFSAEQLQPEALIARLPRLAIETAEQILDMKYDF